MAKRKVKNHKPNNKVKFSKKSKDLSDEMFAKMIDVQFQRDYYFQDMIEEQIQKKMYGN